MTNAKVKGIPTPYFPTTNLAHLLSNLNYARLNATSSNEWYETEMKRVLGSR